MKNRRIKWATTAMENGGYVLSVLWDTEPEKNDFPFPLPNKQEETNIYCKDAYEVGAKIVEQLVRIQTAQG